MKLPEVIPSVRLRQPTPFGNMHLHISVDPQTRPGTRGLCPTRQGRRPGQLGPGGDLPIGFSASSPGRRHQHGHRPARRNRLEPVGPDQGWADQVAGRRSGPGTAEIRRRLKERDGLDAILSGRVTSLDSDRSRRTVPPARRTRKPSSRSSARTVTRPGRWPSRKAA